MEDNTQQYWSDVLASLNDEEPMQATQANWDEPYNCTETLAPTPPGSPAYTPTSAPYPVVPVINLTGEEPTVEYEEPPKKRVRKTPESRNWVFVINNPTVKEVEDLKTYLNGKTIQFCSYH